MDILGKVFSKKKFRCSGCGACCRRVGHLNEEGQCNVYDSRPDICRVDVMYKKKWSKTMTREEAYNLEAKYCNQFVKADRLDEKYLIDIK